MPSHIAGAADEAYRCASISAHRGALALARAVIEAIAKDKGVTSGRLVEKIDAMRDQGLIRPGVAEMAHEIRHIGNDAAHGDFVEPVVEEEALEALELMAEVINEVYESIARMERIREARLAKKAAAKD